VLAPGNERRVEQRNEVAYDAIFVAASSVSLSSTTYNFTPSAEKYAELSLGGSGATALLDIVIFRDPEKYLIVFVEVTEALST